MDWITLKLRLSAHQNILLVWELNCCRKKTSEFPAITKKQAENTILKLTKRLKSQLKSLSKLLINVKMLHMISYFRNENYTTFWCYCLPIRMTIIENKSKTLVTL